MQTVYAIGVEAVVVKAIVDSVKTKYKIIRTRCDVTNVSYPVIISEMRTVEYHLNVMNDEW